MASAKKLRETTGINVRLWGVIIVAIASGAAMLMSPTTVRAVQSQPEAVTACVSPIASCGCTITKSGFYILANDLLSSQGLTGKNGCIDIKASKVVLNTGKPVTSGTTHGGFNITGPGGGTPTGIGIHILEGSDHDFVELPSSVNGWDVGILVEGDDNVVEDFQARFNGTAGAEIHGGSNNNINDFSIRNNLNYGMWLRSASHNQVNCSNTDNNANIGVYVGCSANGPINAKCSPKVPPSNNNQIYDHSADDNTNYGIVIDLGNTGNIVTDIGSFGSGTLDLFDENANCDHNRWFFAGFSTASPSCID